MNNTTIECIGEMHLMNNQKFNFPVRSSNILFIDNCEPKTLLIGKQLIYSYFLTLDATFM